MIKTLRMTGSEISLEDIFPLKRLRSLRIQNPSGNSTVYLGTGDGTPWLIAAGSEHAITEEFSLENFTIKGTVGDDVVLSVISK